jgi:hypothetical protein
MFVADTSLDAVMQVLLQPPSICSRTHTSFTMSALISYMEDATKLAHDAWYMSPDQYSPQKVLCHLLNWTL